MDSGKTFQLYWGADRAAPSLTTDTLEEAYGLLSNREYHKLDALAVGESFVDAEGDEWERIA